ncbi:hypothetical protein E2320_010722 [Naja naja]|nr:hypothetical protein E2320_010722 [Naja naja]
MSIKGVVAACAFSFGICLWVYRYIHNLKPMLSVKGFTNDSVIMEQGLVSYSVFANMGMLPIDVLAFGFSNMDQLQMIKHGFTNVSVIMEQGLDLLELFKSKTTVSGFEDGIASLSKTMTFCGSIINLLVATVQPHMEEIMQVVDELTFGFQDLRTCPEITIFKYIGRYFGI